MQFKRRQFPMVGGRSSNQESSTSRGYDYRWGKLSLDFRRKNPFCKFCEQEGFEASPADDVDHIIPIEDGGARLDPANLQALCKRHHYGRKERLQLYARKHDLISELPMWCSDPSTRPDMTKRR
jgi:5-methylcytosine-specific restriction endonuclease McrA